MAALALAVVPATVVFAVGAPGAALVAGGAVRGSRRAVHYGTVTIVFGHLIASVAGARPLSVAFRAMLAVLAWDAGRYGITLGEQLGREASTTRVAVTHSALNAAVGLAGLGLGYGTSMLVAGRKSTLGLVGLLVGIAVVVLALR